MEVRHALLLADFGARLASATAMRPLGGPVSPWGGAEAADDSKAKGFVEEVDEKESSKKEVLGTDANLTLAESQSDLLSPRSSRINSRLSKLGVTQVDTKSAGVKRLVTNPIFDAFFGLLIVCNAVVIAIEMQYQGLESGFIVKYPGYTTPSSESWPWCKLFLNVMEWFFGLLFTVELILKVVGLGREFIQDRWNLIDCFIVAAWLADRVVLGSSDLPVSPMLLRLFRLVRLLRLLKLARRFTAFDSLRVMTSAIKGSFSVLVWTIVCLFLIQMVIACGVQTSVESFLIEYKEVATEGRHEVFQYYGTFARTMLTSMEMTLGNWKPPCHALVEYVGEFWMIFSLAHKLVIGFAVVTVITGVFIEETFKVATSNDEIMLLQKERAIRNHIVKMAALFEHADSSGDQFLDLQEFEAVLQDPGVRKWLSAMEMDINDVPALFRLIDQNGDRKISIEELVQGGARLKGSARSIDLITLIAEHRTFRKHVDCGHSQTRKEIERLKVAHEALQLHTVTLKDMLRQIQYSLDTGKTKLNNGRPDVAVLEL